jgi:hypothetical protein
MVREALPARILQLGLHAACTMLAGALFAARLPRKAATIASLLFALHPLQVESVVSLSARPVVLAGFLCLLCWHASQQGRPWLAALLFALAPLSHEQAALFPLALLMLGPVPTRPLLAMCAFSLLAIVRAAPPLLDPQVLSQNGVAVLRDLWLFLLPIRLTPAPELRATPMAAALAWGAVAAVVCFALLWNRRVGPSRWLLAALALLVPAAWLAPPQEAGTDRLLYLPMIGLAALAGSAFASASKTALAPVGIVLLLITFSQVKLWTDERALWTEAVRLAPRSAFPKLRLADVSDPATAESLRRQAFAPD